MNEVVRLIGYLRHELLKKSNYKIGRDQIVKEFKSGNSVTMHRVYEKMGREVLVLIKGRPHHINSFIKNE